jgi:signal transduction histidine kinase
MNLIANSIDAVEERLKTDWDESPEVIIQTEIKQLSDSDAQIKDYISIQIADNGLGIPVEIQNRIFESFFTTKPVGKGTGLGLAISHQIIVEKHGGQLILNSTPGVGTEFEILLPLEHDKKSEEG